MFPRVPIFDLDGTWWSPDMYELWGGGGAPFRRVAGTDSEMSDKGRNTVRLLDGTMRLVSELWHNSQTHRAGDGGADSASEPAIFSEARGVNGHSSRTNNVPFVVAAASTCDEPDWAQELLTLFHTRPFPAFETNMGGGRPTAASPPSQPSDSSAVAAADGSSSVPFAAVLGQYDDIYNGCSKNTHMASILDKIVKSNTSFMRCCVLSAGGDGKKEFYVPPIFAAALPVGTSVCPQTGLVTFTDPATEPALRRQLEEEDAAPISYKDFIFFDNQTDNIQDVGSDGITSVYVPEGMTMANWAKGLQQWRREQRSSTGSPTKL